MSAGNGPSKERLAEIADWPAQAPNVSSRAWVINALPMFTDLLAALAASEQELAAIKADVEVCSRHAGDVLIGDACRVCEAEQARAQAEKAADWWVNNLRDIAYALTMQPEIGRDEFAGVITQLIADGIPDSALAVQGEDEA